MVRTPSDLVWPSSRVGAAARRPPKWTQPPLVGTVDAFTADNEATACHPFDPARIEEIRQRLGLGLTYQVETGASAQVRLPTPGAITVLTDPAGGRLVALELGVQAREKLHLCGRAVDTPLPATLSDYPLGGLDVFRGLEWHVDEAQTIVRTGRIMPLAVRLLFRTASTGIQQRWRTGLGALLDSGAVLRSGLADYEKHRDGTTTKLVAAPAGTAPSRFLPSWWDGLTVDPFLLVTQEPARAVLGDLAAGEQVRVHAQVRGGAGRWHACNVGYVLRALGVAGDPADRANDQAYLTLAGGAQQPAGALALVGAGVDVTVSDETTPPAADDLIVLSGGSRDSVLLRPRPAEATPACLYSFTTADDLRVFAHGLQTQALELRLWQPTFTAQDLAGVRAEVTARRGVATAVPAPPATQPMITSEYGVVATRLPTSGRLGQAAYFDILESAWGFDGHRARPPAGTPPVQVSAPPEHPSELTVNLNEAGELRPEHPVWHGSRGAQLRRLMPVLLEGRFPGAAETDWAFLIGQDEIDCVRQEYAFHLRWTPPDAAAHFYQTYADLWDAARRTARIHTYPPDPYHVVTPPGQSRLPGLGSPPLFNVPDRLEIRPAANRTLAGGVFDDSPIQNLAIGILRYRYTRVVYNWRVLRGEVSTRMTTVIEQARAVLAALDQAEDPVQEDLPDYAFLAIQKIYELDCDEQGDEISQFLRVQVLNTQARLRFTEDYLRLGDLLQANSEWRPPEHNESVSVTPISNHQLGEAMDLAVKTFVPAGTPQPVRNPLGMLALHLAAQQLWADPRGPLRELLLERGPKEYLLTTFDFTTAELDYRVRPVPRTGNDFDYTLVDADGNPAPARAGRSIPQQAVTSTTRLDKALVSAFHFAYSALHNSQVRLADMPPPSVLELYVFALCDGSHVHFTWTRPFAA